MSKQSSNKQNKSLPVRNGVRSLTAVVLFLTLLTSGCSSMQSSKAPTRKAVPSTDVIRQYRQSITLMQQEQWQAAVDMLEAITVTQPALSGPWLNLGIAYTKRGNSQGAEDAFKHAIDVNSAHIEAYNQLGILYRRTGRPGEAQFIYESALKLDPDNTSLHWNLAILHDTVLPDPRKALLHYQRYQQLTGADNPQLQSWINTLAEHSLTNNTTTKVNP